MQRNSRGYRIGMTIAGVAAAVAFLVRGMMEGRAGWPLLLLALTIGGAVFLRQVVFRDE